MTEALFARLTSEIGYDDPDALLHDLASGSHNRDNMSAGQGTNQEAKPTSAKTLLDQAQKLVREGDWEDARERLKEALQLAVVSKNEADEFQVLNALILFRARDRASISTNNFLKRAESLYPRIVNTADRVIFCRAKSSLLDIRDSAESVEQLYVEAISLCSGDEDEKGNLGRQGCIVRSSYVHFLCEHKRYEDAEAPLESAIAFARDHADEEDGELMHAALNAAIHFHAEQGNEIEISALIAEFESGATSSDISIRIGGELLNIANELSHRKFHGLALEAAQASIRLGKQAEGEPEFVIGALYTEAMVIAMSGDDATGLEKARAILELCSGPKDAPIRHAAQQLIAEIQRLQGNSQVAVDIARQELAQFKGDSKHLAIMKMHLSISLNDNGQTEDALKTIKEVWHLGVHIDGGKRMRLEILDHIGDWAAFLGNEKEVDFAVKELNSLKVKHSDLQSECDAILKGIEARTQLRGELASVFAEPKPAEIAGTKGAKSLQEANSVVAKPLVQLWDDMRSADFLTASGAYDFWGRGNFRRILLNAQAHPTAFNITLEVRTLEQVKKAIRVWGLYADLLVLLWKGPFDSGMTLMPFPDDYDQPGGAGYIIASGDGLEPADGKKDWSVAMAHITTFPEEVGEFLASEALPFIESGRLVVVPAVSVGCISPGHGPIEQLLAETANAIPSLRFNGVNDTPIGFAPFSPDAPFHMLAELADDQARNLRQLRLLLLKRTQELVPSWTDTTVAKALLLELEEGMQTIESRTDAVFSKGGYVRSREEILGGTTRFKEGGKRLLESDESPSPFAPMLALRSLGFGWGVSKTADDGVPERFAVKENEAVGPWLSAPEPGWAFAMVRRIDGGDEED